MSSLLLGQAFGADMGTRSRKLILLKLVDVCRDDGTKIFPAVKTIAAAGQCSERQVQRELGNFRSIGLLHVVRAGGRGPEDTNEYSLDLAVLRDLATRGWDAVRAGENKGDATSPIDEGRVTPATDKGDASVTQSLNYPLEDINTGRVREGSQSADAGIGDDGFEADLEALFVASGTLAVAADTYRTRAAFSAYTPADRKAAIAALPATIDIHKGFGRSNKSMPALETILLQRRWERVPAEAPKPGGGSAGGGAGAVAPAAVLPPVALGTTEARALERLAKVAGRSDPERHPQGGWRAYAPPTARLLALANTPDDDRRWVFIPASAVAQIAAWREFIATYLGEAAARLMLIRKRFDFPGVGFKAPWDWPPRVDGSPSGMPSTGPPMLDPDDEMVDPPGMMRR